MSRRVIQLSISPAEAMIIELSLHKAWDKNPQLDDMVWLTQRLAHIITINKPRFISMDINFLYELRRLIDPSAKYGQTLGIELITKILKAIELYDPLPEFVLMLHKEQEDARGTCEDADENGAEGGPGETIESGPALS